MSKIKNGGLDQYGAGPFEQQFGTAGAEGAKEAYYLVCVVVSFTPADEVDTDVVNVNAARSEEHNDQHRAFLDKNDAVSSASRRSTLSSAS